jgi:hypothetical protein
MMIAGRLLEGCAQRNLKTSSRIRMGGRDTAPLDDCGGGKTRETSFAQDLLR